MWLQSPSKIPRVRDVTLTWQKLKCLQYKVCTRKKSSADHPFWLITLDLAYANYQLSGWLILMNLKTPFYWFLHFLIDRDNLFRYKSSARTTYWMYHPSLRTNHKGNFVDDFFVPTGYLVELIRILIFWRLWSAAKFQSFSHKWFS